MKVLAICGMKFHNELKEAKANLEVVNSNGQWACDKIEQMELKLSQVAGRLGL